MAPFQFDYLTATIITLGVGFLFGFVLERAGFGNARNLAAQFYLHDMRVLKVMFTAIVVAMLLTFFASAVGLLDFSRVWVPPTYFWPSVLGGFLLGVGFIIGGYCPGTSLVAVATFKVDGLFYSLGVLLGLAIFGETSPAFWGFFSHAGEAGRLTIFDLLGVDAGFVVLGVAVMAVGAFAFAEIMERVFARPGSEPAPFSLGAKTARRAAVVGAIGLAAATLLIGQPTVERKMVWAREGLDQSIQERKIHIDPAELLGLMHNNQVQTVLVDVRRAGEFNQFHLLDAQNVVPEELTPAWVGKLPKNAVVVVMSNDEFAANDAWKRLAVQLNPNPGKPIVDASRVYVLAGGVNRWLDIYQAGNRDAPSADKAPAGDDSLRHRFAASLGSRVDFARPDAKNAPARQFATKVRAGQAKRQAGGGCG